MKKHQPRKRFGQNFLHDPGVIRRIVGAIGPRPGQHLVEIGPGQGALTEPLLEALGELDVVELDRDLIPLLEQRFARLGELRIHSADALRFDFTSLVKGEEKLRIVGNLPYNISTPLIFHLLSQREVIDDMYFMLQKEVVDRLTARPGDKAWGRLGVMTQYHCEAEKLFNVGPGAFNPPPKVDSAIVRLQPHEKLPVTVKDEKVFANLVTQLFSARRKTLRAILKKQLSSEQIESVGIDPQLRPERLSLADFARLADLLVT